MRAHVTLYLTAVVKKGQTERMENKMKRKLMLLTLLQFHYGCHGSTIMKNINEIY